MKIAIICNETNGEDILHFRDVFIEINDKLGKDYTLIVYGYNKYVKDALTDVQYEYLTPTSIIHYFKQLKHIGIDLLLVPLIKNLYNETSENYNKYLEAGLFNIPVLAPNIFPYNKIIESGKNGFIFNDKKEIIKILTRLKDNKKVIKEVGEEANKNVLSYFSYSDNNIKLMSDCFSFEN